MNGSTGKKEMIDMAVARKSHRQLLPRQMMLDGKVEDARFAAVPELDDWKIPSALNPLENATFCLKHWPEGEGRALRSPYGWTSDGRALYDLGWRPDGQWGPVGTGGVTAHHRRGDLGVEV